MKIPHFEGYELEEDGKLYLYGQQVRPDTYANGDLKYVLESGQWFFSGPCWRLMLEVFYKSRPEGVEPDFVNGDRFDHSLSNLIFGEVDRESGLWDEIPWVEEGQFRRFDRRLRRRIKVNETGMVYDSLTEVAKAVGGQKQNVSAVLHGRLKSHCGRTFSYVDFR